MSIPTVTFTMGDRPTHCPQCHAEYKNIGHPLRPGVIMMITCDCEVVTKQVSPGLTVSMLVPPKGFFPDE